MGIILGPNGTPFEAYPEGFQSFLSWVRELRLPVLGICGGHQALALAHGGRLGSVFSPDKPTLSYDGFSKLSGSIDIETLVESPLTEGLPPVFQVQASHVEEVKHLPSPFTAIFSHQHSPIQGFSNAARHHYGVQFHPERSASGTPPVRLLQNWLAIASDAFKSRE
jgi:GMP synthase (glutamine-hydrolysing)